MAPSRYVGLISVCASLACGLDTRGVGVAEPPAGDDDDAGRGMLPAPSGSAGSGATEAPVELPPEPNLGSAGASADPPGMGTPEPAPAPIPTPPCADASCSPDAGPPPTDACSAQPCGDAGRCTPEGESYTCACDDGFRFDGTTCVDVDECEASPCQQLCANTLGGFECSCFLGFEPVPEDPQRCRGQAGTECASADECSSGFCTDGACCDVAECGTCQRCAAGAGTCQPITNANDDTCSGALSCDGDSACKQVNGVACASDTDCVSGQCADGVCCGSACDGVCQSCAIEQIPGFCVSVIEAPDPDTCGAAQQTCGTIATCVLVDQGQTRAELSRGVGGAIRQELAQVVVPASTGRLEELEFHVTCPVEGEQILVEVQGVANGQPDGFVVAVETLPSRVEGAIRTHLFQPVAIAAGVPFAVVLRSTGNFCGAFTSDGDAYPAGAYFFRNTEQGADWIAFPTEDLAFQTFVVP